MIHLDVCVIAVILTSTSALDLCSDPHKGPCKKTSQCEPSVIPMNSTHLLVNWENVLSEGCQESHIENMDIVILENGSSVRQFRKTVSRDSYQRQLPETVARDSNRRHPS